MAGLRAVEERDSKGNTIRVNPSVTFKSDQFKRVIVGRHDYRMDENANFHEPVTAQVQNGKVVFFFGTPDTATSRSAAKEIAPKDVPPYIFDMLKKNPIRVREPRPTVYEVKIATVGDVEVTETTELQPDETGHVHVAPSAPKLNKREAARPYNVEAPV